jgi:hypothetical protein
MTWTAQLPQWAGVYWHFDQRDFAICEIVIDADNVTPLALLTGDDQLYDAADFTGLWFGPLDPPERPRNQGRNSPMRVG